MRPPINRKHLLRSKEIIMKGISFSKPLSAIILSALGLPALVQADCVPSAPVGYTVPFKLVSLENYRSTSDPDATYVDGGLTVTAHSELFRGTTLSSADNQRLFSDRTYCRDSGSGKGIHLCGLYQPFDADQAGTLSVSITDGESLLPVFPPKGHELTVTLHDKDSYSATCDSASEALYFSDGSTMYVMTFGTPVAPLPQPK
jgi:hypothetical protein